MIDEQRNAQWRANGRLTIVGLIVLAIVLIVPSLSAPWLDDIHILRFPLGYFLITLGSVAGMVALVFWFSARQSRIDQRYNISGDY
jgi:putative solute:sodium symporter small subunit